MTKKLSLHWAMTS